MSDILPESVPSVVVVSISGVEFGSAVVEFDSAVVDTDSVVADPGSFVVDNVVQFGHGVSSISVQFPSIPHSNVL